jgi:hypothetical protein
MQKPFEFLLNFNIFDLAFNFLSHQKIDTITKESIKDVVNFHFLTFRRNYNLLDKSEKQIIEAKVKIFGNVKPSHLSFGSIILEDDNDLYSIYKFDPIKVSYHKYFFATLLNLLYTLFKIEDKKPIENKKIKGVIVASFFRHLSNSVIYPKAKEERVIDYCLRINEHFHLPIHKRIETDFGVAENRFDSIKSYLLPLIQDSDVRKVLEKYFDELSR